MRARRSRATRPADPRRRRRARGWRARTGAGRRRAPRPARRRGGAPTRDDLGIGSPEQLGLAVVGHHQPEQHPHGRGLAGAVGAEEAVDVALADVEVDVVDGAHVAVRLGQAAGLDHRVLTTPLLELDRGLPQSGRGDGSGEQEVASVVQPRVGVRRESLHQQHRQRADLERHAPLGRPGVPALGELLVQGSAVESRRGTTSRAVGPRP